MECVVFAIGHQAVDATHKNKGLNCNIYYKTGYNTLFEPLI
jgi:hypothetical protein